MAIPTHICELKKITLLNRLNFYLNYWSYEREEIKLCQMLNYLLY